MLGRRSAAFRLPLLRGAMAVAAAGTQLAPSLSLSPWAAPPPRDAASPRPPENAGSRRQTSPLPAAAQAGGRARVGEERCWEKRDTPQHQPVQRPEPGPKPTSVGGK